MATHLSHGVMQLTHTAVCLSNGALPPHTTPLLQTPLITCHTLLWGCLAPTSQSVPLPRPSLPMARVPKLPLSSCKVNRSSAACITCPAHSPCSHSPTAWLATSGDSLRLATRTQPLPHSSLERVRSTQRHPSRVRSDPRSQPDPEICTSIVCMVLRTVLWMSSLLQVSTLPNRWGLNNHLHMLYISTGTLVSVSIFLYFVPAYRLALHSLRCKCIKH